MIGDSKKHLVSTMTERDKLKANLKSSLYSLSIDELVIQAINSYEREIEPMNCPYCKEKTVVSSKEKMVYSISIDNQDYDVRIINYPRNYCKSCNKEFKDHQTTMFLSELIDMEVFRALRYEGEVPKEFDLRKLIVMSGKE
ncbi:MULTISPECIES: hypothetical protein [Oceanobacillus]|uniref:hypothetical protein n=1 Tax=Oceanobacillus TaxID=182709 RepID=UPI000595FCEF|nr:MULTISPECIES: hypothetical protein [Oceanobacillus]